MQQKIFKKPINRYGRARPCHFCRRVINPGEECIFLQNSSWGNMGFACHRMCLDRWLANHPPLDGSVPTAVKLEEEFEALRERLLKEQRAANRRNRTKTTKKTPSRKVTARKSA